MLLNIARIRSQIRQCRELAANIANRLEAGERPSELLPQADALRALLSVLNDAIPGKVRGTTALERHLGFAEHYLKRNDPEWARGNLLDIVDRDLLQLESNVEKWYEDSDLWDSEPLAKVTSLLLDSEQHDSAIRKAFVVLKDRIVATYGVSSKLDGAELVNSVFGTKSAATSLPPDVKQSWRDLLVGMYGVLRNPYAHTAATPALYETDAAIAVINLVLKKLPELK
jgi:hypothetical protein